MPIQNRFNGVVSTFIKGSSTGGENAVLTGISDAPIVAGVPNSFAYQGWYGIHTVGISGTYSVEIVASIAGATYTVAGVTGIGANGSTIIGSTTLPTITARPAYVQFASAEDGSGFTSTITFAGR